MPNPEVAVGYDPSTMGANTCTIYAVCRVCNTPHSADCNDMKSFLDWYAGKGLAQDMMPGLTIAFRELLISGTCGTCFDKMFKPEEGEDEL